MRLVYSLHNLRFFRMSLISILIFSLFGFVSAQSEQLEFGTTKFASIATPGEVDTYSFQAIENDSVNIKITVTGGEMRAGLSLYSPDGILLKTVSTSLASDNKKEMMSKLPKTGTYTILAENGWGSFTGEYSIFCQKVNNPVNSANLQFGTTKSASIAASGEVDTYSFKANENDSVNIKITITGGEMRAGLSLYSPEGNLLKTVSTSLASDNKKEIASKLPITGIYTILVENGWGSFTGNYSIFMQRVSSDSSSTSESDIFPIETKIPGKEINSSNSSYSIASISLLIAEKFQGMSTLIFIILFLIIAILAVIFFMKKKEKPKKKVEPINISNKHDVFISHSSKDKAIADAVCAALEAAKIRCWIAPRDILGGEKWAGAINSAIKSSSIMVLIFSENSNNSDDVLNELQLAKDAEAIIIPFKIGDIFPNGDMEYYLKRTHWLDAMDPPTEKQIQTLVETVGRFSKSESLAGVDRSEKEGSIQEKKEQQWLRMEEEKMEDKGKSR